ncbi:MAG: 3'-5' exonuclease [Gammaproteobacteria bacterium]
MRCDAGVDFDGIMNRSRHRTADSVVVLDFETSGLSPDRGDRAIEIGAVRMHAGQITDRFQSLMNPGIRVSAFIEDFTGITNAMVRTAPPCEEVMESFAGFIGDSDLVAHNASFDRRFLDAELRRIGRAYPGEFACSMLIARRVYPDAPDHKLGTLVRLNRIPASGIFHRALADAEMTAGLWLGMLQDIADRHRIDAIPFKLMQELSQVSRSAVQEFLGGQYVCRNK